jgi:ABC-2 type transport system permease protein
MNNYLDLLREFFVTDFKLRYKHSYLGFLWVIIKPLSYYAILYTIWTSLFGNTENFASYLLIGIFVISYFSEGVQFGLQALQNKQHIILKVNFPREIVVLSSVAIATINFFINLTLFALFRVSINMSLVSEHWWLLVLGIVYLTVLLLGIAFFISVISIKLTDIKHLVELLIQLVFWATPVFYQVEQLPSNIAFILARVNPLVLILNMVRGGVFLGYPSPEPEHILTLGVLILTFTAIGYGYFKRRLPKLAEYF